METPRPQEDLSAQGELAQKALAQLRANRTPEDQAKAAKKEGLLADVLDEAASINRQEASDDLLIDAQDEQSNSQTLLANLKKSKERIHLRGLTKEQLGQIVKTGFINWARNLDPRGKDRAWVLGVAVGGTESLALMANPLFGKGLIKAGVNAAAMHGFWAVHNWNESRRERSLNRKFSGDELTERLQRHQEKYAKGTERARNFFAGVAAGSVYFSAFGVGLEMVKVFPLEPPFAPYEVGDVTSEPTVPDSTEPSVTPQKSPLPAQPTVTPTSTPTPAAGPGGLPAGAETSNPTPTAEPTPLPKGTPSASPTAFPTVSPTVTPSPTGVPSPAAGGLSPDQTGGAPSGPGLPSGGSSEAAIKAIADNPQYLTEKAAEVGKVLPIQDEIIQEALAQNHLNSVDVDPGTLEQARLAVQHTLETNANTFFDNNLNAAPQAGLEGVVKAGKTSFETWVNTPDAHQQLVNVAKIATSPEYLVQKAAEVGKVLPAQDELIRQVVEQSNFSPEAGEAALDKARLAVQRVLEAQANTSFDSQLAAHSSAGLNGVTEAGRTSFEAWLSSQAAHDHLAEVARQAVEQGHLNDSLAQNVSTALESVPNTFTD